MSGDINRRTAPASLDEATLERYSQLRKIVLFAPDPQVVREFAMVHNGRGLSGLILFLRGRALSRQKAEGLLRSAMQEALTAAFHAAPNQHHQDQGASSTQRWSSVRSSNAPLDWIESGASAWPWFLGSSSSPSWRTATAC